MTPDDIERLQQMINHGGTEAFTLIPAALKKIILEKQWQGRVDKNGKPFANFEAFVTHRLWQGLETTIDELLLYCRKQPKIKKLILAEMEPGRESRGSTKDERNNRTDNITPIRHGTSATYTMKRLKRDRPDLFSQVLEGELSANAAAIKAGWRKKKTPLEQMFHCWQKCTQSEKDEFLDLILETERRNHMDTTTQAPDEPKPEPEPPPPPGNGD
jgi:hypothetical protein